LYLNTSEDRYATLFYAVYDPARQELRYTNAGHLPPIFLEDDRVVRLDVGGTVVGLMDGCSYEQAAVKVKPGSLFVAYSDGLIEPENVFGQEFGVKRLEEEVLRRKDSPAQGLAESLVTRVEEWGGSPEHADDMTVIVAKFG
jgi:sigma-B regulation protein RsbU (phosphoserine phosphatase)